MREVIESARRVTGHPIPAEIHPRRPGDPAVLVASSQKAMRELGWKPRYTQLDEIVRTAWVVAPEALQRVREVRSGRCQCSASICFRQAEQSRRSTPSRAAWWRIARPSWTAICACFACRMRRSAAST